MEAQHSPISFGHWLKERRRGSGLTQKALAQQVNCATVTIKRIEANGIRPSQQLVELILRQLAVPSTDWAALIQLARARPASPPPAAPPVAHNPYKGLQPFGVDDQPDFYGRATAVGELLERLQQQRFVALVGPSGVGKSSLVLAGLVPQLQHSDLFVPGPWSVRLIHPGERPLAQGRLLLDLAPILLDGAQPHSRVLVVVDPFEAVLDGVLEEALAFQQALLRLHSHPQCYVVLVVRADRSPELIPSPLWPLIQAHRYQLPLVSTAALREAICGPAARLGVATDMALVERLLRDFAGEPAALSLLQETLWQLWERRSGPLLTLADYQGDGPGGPATLLHAVLAQRAEAALAALPEHQQQLARRIVLRLVQFVQGRPDTRRQQTLAQLLMADSEPGMLRATLDVLAGQRLITLGATVAGEPTVDLAHDGLIDGWPRLQGWLAAWRAAEQSRRWLEAKAHEWVRVGCGPAGRLDSAALSEALDWLESPAALVLGWSNDLAALVVASRAALAPRLRADLGALVRRARWWALLVVWLVGGVLAGVLVQ